MIKKFYKTHGGISSGEHYLWARKEHSVKQTSKPGVYKIKNETVVRNGLGNIPKKKQTSQEVKDSTDIMLKYQKAEKRKDAVKKGIDSGKKALFNSIKVGANSLSRTIKDATISDRAEADKKKVKSALSDAYKNIKKNRR